MVVIVVVPLSAVPVALSGAGPEASRTILAVEAEEDLARHLGEARRQEPHRRQHAAQRRLGGGEILRRGDVALVEDDDVGGAGLLDRELGGSVVERAESGAVDEAEDAVDRDTAAERRVEERVDDGDRPGDAARLDEEMPGRGVEREEPFDRRHEVVADGAADAAVGERDLVRAGRDHELGIDVDVAEIVHQHAVADPARVGEDAPEKRRLPGAEKAREERDRDRARGALTTAASAVAAAAAPHGARRPSSPRRPRPARHPPPA